MKKIFSVLMCGVLLFGNAKAQYYLGLATGNWSGSNSLYINPALSADNREKFSIDLFSVNVGANNNLGTVGNISDLVNRSFSGGNFNAKNFFNYSSNAQFDLVAPMVEVRGPGFLVNIKGKHTIAVTTRIRAINQFENFDQSLYRILLDPSHLPSQDVYHVTSQNFNWTAHLWSEAGISYSTVLLNSGYSRIKIGGTLRYLGGIGYIGIKGDNLDVTYVNSRDSLNANHSGFTYASNLLSTDNAFVNGLSNNTIVNALFGPKSGSGIGGDIGIVYEYRTTPSDNTADDGNMPFINHAKNGYKFRVAASVVDMGSITYSTGNYNAAISGNGIVTAKDIATNLSNFTNFFDYVKSRGFTADTSGRSTKLYMPTALNLNIDYHIHKKFYVTLMYIANLQGRKDFGNSIYDQISVIPRYDCRRFSLALPLTYNSLANDYKMGVAFRYSGFFIGSDDALAFISNNNYGFNFYLGGYVPVNYKKMADRDHDGVPDIYDSCPDEPGTPENNGCPAEPDSEHGGSSDDRY
jgi:Family of unknown function (DUF5723)